VILPARPPGVTEDRKWDFGIWEAARLVAFVDVIVGWPQASTAHIGLLITDGARGGQGFGRMMHGAVVDRLAQHGDIETLRLSIVETNAAIAEPFWRRMGYRATGALKPYAGGTVPSTARVWVRPVPGK
jgi:ribosomal protein S18 acetylase RimI-like enzyme